MRRKKKNSTAGVPVVRVDQKEEAQNGITDKESTVRTQLDGMPHKLQLANGFFIVGIGASAGGLEAFKQFLSHMPPDSGMAFVLIQHMDPGYKSALVDILKEYTTMRIFQVESGMLVEPNCVYIKPPDKDMMLSNGIFHLVELRRSSGFKHSVDFFFQSLAEDRADKAIGIIFFRNRY
ncbi:MAG: chemotaxis protein CheB [Candidatus Brocadia sp.]